MNVYRFVKTFRAWLGEDPESAAQVVAERSGYSLDYVRWVAGLVGSKAWPGSRRFIRRMRALGCGKLWRERTPEQLTAAFRSREVLHDPEV